MADFSFVAECLVSEGPCSVADVTYFSGVEFAAVGYVLFAAAPFALAASVFSAVVGVADVLDEAAEDVVAFLQSF